MSTLTLSGLITDLKASMLDAAGKFTASADADFQRHLDLAALDLSRIRPRTLSATITLVADQASYAAPADLDRPRYSVWGDRFRAAHKPWDKAYPQEPLPRLHQAEEAGTLKLWLHPAPTAAQIAAFGSDYPYFYLARHILSDTAGATTVQDADRGLLLLRAQAEAMKELSAMGVVTPIQLHHGMGSTPANGTPLALYERLMADFEKAAA